MGTTHVNVVVRSPASPSRSWEVRFPVDTGVMDSSVSRPPLDTIDFKPKGRRVYERTDGSKVGKELTTGEVEFTNEVFPGPIIIGDAQSEPLLGVTNVASVGVAVNPQSQRLETVGSVRLKRNTAR